jgi:beta-carotene hydroxylase
MRNRADVRTLAYLTATVGLFFYQWTRPELANWWLYPLTLFFGYSAAVISHNQNHAPMWGKNRLLNLLTNCIIGIFYGHPAIGWVPTHNQNHHKFNNREGDLSISPRYFKRNHLLALITYPTATSMLQTPAIRKYIWEVRKTNPRLFWEAVTEYVVFFGLMIAAFVISWKKALVLLLIPQQLALFLIQCTNYLQHIECDPESQWNHSRNFEGWLLNTVLFNNGYHTVHHFKPGIHWSETPKLHREMAHRFDPELRVRSMPVFLFDMYFLSPLRGQTRRPTRVTRPDREEPVAGDPVAVGEKVPQGELIGAV